MEYTNNKKKIIQRNVNSNNKSSKYFLSSTKKSQNQNYTIDSENNKILFISEEENKNFKNIANDVRIQNNILEIYKNWVSTLLSVINNNELNNTYNDIGTPIQQNLEYIEKLREENFKIKKKIINQKLKNENMEQSIENKQKTQNMIIKEFNEKEENIKKIEKEKEQLIENVQILANELDEINENNKNLNDKIMKDEKLKNIYELVNMRNKLIEENKLYKKIFVLKKRKNLINSKETFQNINDITIDLKENGNKKLNLTNKKTDSKKYGSLGPITGCGEYKLEKEENIHSNGNIFLCGL